MFLSYLSIHAWLVHACRKPHQEIFHDDTQPKTQYAGEDFFIFWRRDRRPPGLRQRSGTPLGLTLSAGDCGGISGYNHPQKHVCRICPRACFSSVLGERNKAGICAIIWSCQTPYATQGSRALAIPKGKLLIWVEVSA